uniref:Uncharacterized protein n=1 Tax=Babesia bovis TaxID=5865 RepID=A7AM18_BABBO|eukprot:XP_001611170.1 hypothetical protein [Babesia bovis T2Bo]
MEDLCQVLSSLVSDRVRHFELVKITSNALQGKAYVIVADGGLHLVTCSLSSVLKGGSFRYETIDSVKQYNNVIKLRMSHQCDSFVKTLDLVTPCKTQLFAKIREARSSYHMFATAKEPESSSDDHSASPEPTLLPFKGYKKVTLNGYFLFVRNTFDNTTFTSGNLIRLQDSERGICLNVNLREPVYLNLHDLAKPQDLYRYARGILNELGVTEILYDGVYNKRMNLNNDLAIWSCYHMLLRTESSIGELDMARVYNEISTTANSITAIDQYNMWYKELMQVRLDNLRFEHPMYAFLMRKGGIVPSYHKLIKGFVLSVIRLLPNDTVDSHVIHRLTDSMVLASDDPMDYIYNVKGLMFGIGTSEESRDRKELINRFDMRLSDYIAICMDELLMDTHLSLAVLTQYLNLMDDDSYKKKLREVTAYLLHFRSTDFSKDYSPMMLDDMIDAYRTEHGGYNWCDVTFNHYATSRMVEQGFFIHQYVDDLRNQQGYWNPYLHFVSDLLERYDDYTIMERILKKFLDIPQPIDASYLPLLKCMIVMLRRYKTNYKIVVIVTSILTNFSYNSSIFKDEMIKHDIATIIIDNMLSNEEQIVLSTLKLMVNLTKTSEHQKAFIGQGVVCNIILLLEKHHARNSEIMGYTAGVLGQLCNSGFMKIAPKQLEYAIDALLFAYHVGAADTRYLNMVGKVISEHNDC